MDSIVNNITNTNPNKDSELENLKKFLEGKLEAMAKAGHTISNALSVLNPNANTLGCCYLLFVKLTMPQTEPNFLPLVENFLTQFDGKQARLAGDKFAGLIHGYTRLCIESKQPMRGILPLSAAIPRIQERNGQLTCIHGDLALLCLVSKNYKAAVRTGLLSNPITNVPQKRSGLAEPRDLLLYYYYTGMLNIGLKNFSAALHCFKQSVGMPAHCVNAIVVESFKKHVLVELLVEGKYNGAPKNSPPALTRYANEYVEFGNIYNQRNFTKLTDHVNKYAEAFTRDSNLGLVKQCLRSLSVLNVQKLKQTYLTLSLADITEQAKLTAPRDTELLILRMIEENKISATISQKDGNGMVAFTEVDDESSWFNGQTATKNLHDRIDNCIKLAQRIKGMDDEIGSSFEYVAKTCGGDRLLRDQDLPDDMMMADRPGKGGRGVMDRMLGFFKA